MYIKILFLLMQNVVISAGKESKESTLRSRSLTPKSRRIKELEEKFARAEEQNVILAEENARLEEEKKRIKDTVSLVGRFKERISETDQILSNFEDLVDKGSYYLEKLKLEASPLRFDEYSGIAKCAAGLAIVGVGAGVVFAAGTGVTLCSTAVLGATVGTVTVGSILLCLGGIGVAVVGLLVSLRGGSFFLKNYKNLKINKSQEEGLINRVNKVAQCKNALEMQCDIMKNLLNQKKINIHDCHCAFINFGDARDNFDKAMKQLQNYMDEIF